MAFEVGAIVSKLELRKDQWNQSIKKVKEDQKSLSGLVLRNSQSFAKMGRAMTVAGGVIVGGVGLMVKAFAGFDQAMTESLAIMGDVSDETRKQMSEIAKTISEETTYSAKELAEAYFFLASAGMDASQSMTVLGDVARFAQAGAFDLSTATDLLTDAQTALGLSSKDAVENQKNLVRVSDVLVGANTLANASVKQFAESLTNKASAALVNVNKEVEEGVAILAAYADKGVKGTLAGQRLTMMMNGLFDATRKNKKAWDEAGISLFEADGSMRSIADIIQDLEGYLGDMTVKQREAALAQLGFNLRTKDSILTLMGSSEKIRKWTEDLKNMGGKTKEVSEKQLEAFNNQLKLLKNTVTNAAISIGESLAPMIKDLIVKIKDVSKSVSDWIKEHPKLTAIIAKATLGIGALMTFLGPLAMMLPGLVQGFALLKLSFTSMLGPIGLVVTGLGFITIEVIKLTNNFKSLSATIDEYSDKSGEKISWLKKTWFSLNATIDKFTNGIGISEIASRKMREEIEKLDKKHAEYGEKVWDSIKGTKGFSKASEFLNKLLGKQKEIVKEDTGEINEYGDAIEGAAEKTKTWIDYIKTVGIMTIKEKSDRVKELGGYVDGLSRAYAAGEISLEDYTKALKTARDEIELLSTSITTTAIPSFRDMSGVVEQATDEMESEFYDTSGVIKESTENTEKAVEKSWDELHPFMSNLCSNLGGIFGNFANSILSTGSNLSDALQGFWNDIKGSFIGMVADMFADWATNFIKKILSSTSNELVPGVTSSLNKITGSASSAGTSAGASLTTSFASALAVEAVVFTAFLGAVSLLDKLFPKHVKTMAELAAIEAKKAFDKAAKEYALPGEWGKGGIIAEPETGGGGQVPAEPEGNYQTGGLVPKTGLAMVHKGEFIIPKISVPSMNFPEPMNIKPLPAGGSTKIIEVKMDLQQTFAFNNQVDPNFTKKYVLNEIIPMMYEGIETGARKTRLKEILGVS